MPFATFNSIRIPQILLPTVYAVAHEKVFVVCILDNTVILMKTYFLTKCFPPFRNLFASLHKILKMVSNETFIEIQLF